MFYVYSAFDSEDGEYYSLDEYKTEEEVFAAKRQFDEDSSGDSDAIFIVIQGQQVHLQPKEKEVVKTWELSPKEPT